MVKGWRISLLDLIFSRYLNCLNWKFSRIGFLLWKTLHTVWGFHCRSSRHWKFHIYLKLLINISLSFPRLLMRKALFDHLTARGIQVQWAKAEVRIQIRQTQPWKRFLFLPASSCFWDHELLFSSSAKTAAFIFAVLWLQRKICALGKRVFLLNPLKFRGIFPPLLKIKPVKSANWLSDVGFSQNNTDF